MSNEITLKNVRLSFPSLFKRAEYAGNKLKYETIVLIPKSDEETYNLIQLKTAEMLVKHGMTENKLKLKDGDESVSFPNHAGHWTLKVSNSFKPVVKDDNKLLTEEDGKIYPGCIANVTIDLSVETTLFGKLLKYNLLSVKV